MARSRKPSVWIEKRRSSTGYVTYRVRREKDGRRLPDIACGPDRARAVRVRDEQRSQLWNRRLRIKEDLGQAPTVSQFAARDREERSRRVAGKTVYNDQRALRLLQESAGDVALDEIDRQALEDLVAFLERREFRQGAKGSPRRHQVNGIRIVLRALKAALRRAMKADPPLLERDPFFGFEMPPEEEVAHPPTKEEIDAAWDEIPPEGQCALTVIDTCGLRRGEVFRICPESLTPPEHAGKPWVLRVQKTKTRRGRVEFKTMALHPAALAALQRMKPWAAGKPIFKMYPSTLSSWVRKARLKAGLPRIRLHDFRHRWATRLAQVAQDDSAVMQAGGWTSKAAFAKYQHPTEQRRDVTLKQTPELPPILPPNEGGRKARKRGGHS